MKFVSFNINGLRARPHQLAAIVEKHQPDVIGLQETKVHDDMFPLEEVARLGYNVFYHGQKGHYGVALLTKETPIAVRRGFPDDGEEAQRRIIMAEIPSPFGNVTVINGYFPQGESRDHETKFPAKAAFYQNLQNYLETELNKENPVLIMGDMNISPTDLDIGIGEENRKRWLRTGKCSFLPEEREWMDRLLGWGLVDTWRQANPDNHEHFSWFDYRSKGFDDNRGLRIDSAAGQPASGAALRGNRDRLRDPRDGKTVRPRAGVGHLPAIIHALLSPPAVRGQNFLSKINKATVNHCDGRRNRILSRALFDVHCVQTVQEHLSCKRSRHPAIGKGLGLLALVATLAVISHRVGLHDLLTHLHLLQDTLRHQGAWGYLVYAALFIIATLCLIPGSLLVIAGGMLFGPLTGSLLSFAAATLASSLSFLIARWLGRDLLQRYVGHTTVFQAIERGIARSGCDFLILTRLVPLFPYNIQNYAYGLTAIRFWPFTLISAVTTLPGLVIYSVMASELAREGVTLAFALKLSLAGGLLFTLVQIGKRFARARRVAACSEEVRHDPT